MDKRGPIVIARHGRLRTGHPLLGLLRLLGIALAVVAVSAASIGGFAVWDVASNVKQGIHLAKLPGQTDAPPPDIGAIEGGVNLLLVGTDTRTDQGGAFSSKAELAGSSGAGNNDVTMLMHIAEDHKSATVVSFPRDLMIPVPSCPRTGGGSYPALSTAMFNSTLARGGLSCVVLTVEKMTGLKIPYAAMISFDGVIAMSNAVGGVTVCLATPIKDVYTNPALNLPAGQVTLVGAQALSFLRSRHGVGDGSDLGRISNQQVFLAALTRKVTSGGVLANPIQLYSLAKAAVNALQLSDTLTKPTTMVEIAIALRDVGLGNLVFLQYPTATDPANQNRVVPIASAAAVLNAALVADRPLQLSGDLGRAAVADPTATTVPTPTETSATGTPTPTESASSAVVLPSAITGQTAAQQTCSSKSR
ncbi:MAG TPA: LCP family protein [Lacisediminihabitans sp.]|uniref:LCP family protein n=1 Tax=Lacisediminihabitans sp. TaxID=2787631 RepID=UPI002ED8F461